MAGGGRWVLCVVYCALSTVGIIKQFNEHRDGKRICFNYDRIFLDYIYNNYLKTVLCLID